ncbi:cyclic nucleotide-binding domain-containing protein [Aquabacterium soli]|jgi:CRP-like cAMP-binding protein|uniref:Cyclic nucleotide-binding domain-containing protein n=1 Tax=Aquabacterium soli TaxID=2493092 RepID=A0A3R8T499_9BURK|nr:cyclic nucleotide-binding domain-containing protein [Aquabacterium soli]RRS03690.1 cyclic nucleotide-binding domain-containing protein [Aquabacterium soli]
MDATELVHAIQTLNAEDSFRPRLDAQQWRVFCQYLTRHELRSGDLLIKQGDHDRTVYFLGQGSLQVFVTGAAPGASRIAILRAGSVLGEPGLFADGPRMANVEAMTPCVVWALRLPRFEELAARVPQVAVEVVRAAGALMAQRMRANMLRQIPSA